MFFEGHIETIKFHPNILFHVTVGFDTGWLSIRCFATTRPPALLNQRSI